MEAFEFTDGMLKTLIGCADGKIYERLFKYASEGNSMNLKHPSIQEGISHMKGIRSIRARL